MIKMIRIFLILLASVGFCGDSYTSLGPYSLWSTIAEAQNQGYILTLDEESPNLYATVYKTKISGNNITLIFAEGLLHSITMRFENSNMKEYRNAQQEFITKFGRMPNVDNPPNVIPQYITVWWHTRYKTNFSLNYDHEKQKILYMTLDVRMF